MRFVFWLSRFLIRRTIGVVITLVITLLFGRSAAGRQARFGVGLLRRLFRV